MWKKYNKFASGGAPGLPTGPGQTGRRSVCGDESMEESQLEAELYRLKRQLRMMEGDRRAYSEEVGNAIRKQQEEIRALNEESRDMNKILRLTTSERNRDEDDRHINILTGLIDKLDEYKRLCKQEERRIEELTEDIAKTQEMINEERKIIGSVTEVTLEMSIAKRLHVTENRLDQAVIKFNQQLARNAKLREELDHLRNDKATFDALHKKLTDQLEERKWSINDSITQAAHAYEERDEAQNKMLALKERSDKDMAQQIVEMKELQRIIIHDNKLKEFMGIKVHDRADLREEEHAKKAKGKDSGDKDADVEKQSIMKLEEAFKRVTEATGEHDISKIVSEFIKKEDQNFAMYNYVNELSDTVESIQEEIKNLKNEIKLFEDDNVKGEESRRKMVRDMESKALQFEKEIEEAEKKDTEICKVLDEVRVNVSKLFKDANCDPSTISDMLGSENGVTNNNILQYMGIIEQRTMELVKLQQYIQMKKEPPKQEKKDSTKGQPTPPASQASGRTSPKQVQVAIVAPTSVDDEEFDDGEIRPLTRNEIKSYVLKTITTKMASGEHIRKSAGKRTKTKSPNSLQ